MSQTTKPVAKAMVQMTVRLDIDNAQRLIEAAAAERKSRTQLLNEIIEDWGKRRKARKA